MPKGYVFSYLVRARPRDKRRTRRWRAMTYDPRAGDDGMGPEYDDCAQAKRAVERALRRLSEIDRAKEKA